jgi:hypothetical protein
MNLFVNEQMHELSQRRNELLARIASQRKELSEEIDAEWKAPLAMADKGIALVNYVRNHPMLLAVVGAMFVFRRRSAAGLMWGLWSAWKGFRKFTSDPAK